MHYPRPQNEPERLAKLLEYEVLDSLPEQSYDDLTAIAAHICGTPIALVSLLDSDRQWFKSHHGIDVTETPREHAFCNYTITQPDAMLVVADALEDERFQKNPLVLENPNIRFYAGTSLINPEGMPLGTLCVIDHTPRELTSQQREVLCALGRQVMAQLELRRKATQLQQEKQALQQALQQLRLTQSSLIEIEKTSAIGNLVIDITQRLSNPLTFIHGNLAIGKDYAEQLLELVSLYQAESTNSSTIGNFIQNIDLDFIAEDLPNLFTSMQNGMNQVNCTVTSLRIFVSDGEAGEKLINIHENLDAVCHLLNSRLQKVATRSTVALVKRYSEVPYIACHPQLLNQALMYLIDNA
ncbi:MAG: GAF domain-containing protein, partial [Cyanobacteria bacterium J06626_14]